MRPWLLALAPLGLAQAAAQGPPLGPPPPVWEVPPQPPAAPPGGEGVTAPPLGQQDTMRADLLLGLPTGLRLSWAALRRENRSFSLEGIAGLYFVAPMAAVGCRYSRTVCAGQCNALVLRPGVDAYAAFNPFYGLFGDRGLWGVGGDMQILWSHEGRRHCSELGLDLGVIAVRGESWGAVPLVSLVAGLHF